MIGRRGRKQSGRRFLPGAVTLLALVLALLAAPAAQARVTLVATGTPELTFLGIPGNEVVARLALPGASRAVAVSRDGARGYVSAGGEVVAVDVNTRIEAGRSALGPGPEIADIDLSPGGETLYAVRGAQLAILDPQTLAQRAVIELRGEGMQLAIANNGTAAAITLRGGRVAMVALGSNELLRRVKLKGATGVAIADNGMTYVTARERLRVIARGQRRVRRKAIRLPAGAGGALTLSPGRSRLVVGAAPDGLSAAIVELRNESVRRLVAGRGLGRAAWYPDASRIVMADGGAATVSLISPFSRGRVALVTLPGTTPSDLVVQPGLALITGTDAADQITGTRGDDKISGLGGDDLLRGGRGRDLLDGGSGNDRLLGGNNSDTIVAGDGDDLMIGDTGDDELSGGPGADSADGGTGNDTIQGDDGDDRLDGGDGDDTILAGPGNDVIEEKGFGDDKMLNGGPGDDIIRGGRGNDQFILGEEGDDQLFGESGHEKILGGEGNDLVDGGRAADRLEGGPGDDTIFGRRAKDSLNGDEGSDRLDGGSGPDALAGGDGNDELVGGSSPDVLDGGPGDDSIRAADDSADTVLCGPGNDTVYVEDLAPARDVLTDCELVLPVPIELDNDGAPISVIRGTDGDDKLFGTPGIDSMFGRDGDDKLFAKAGDDYVDGELGDDELHGGDGADIIAGRGGDDALYGNEGNDRITGDRGRDRIFGGAGNDTIFGNLDPDEVDGGSGNDRISVINGGADSVVCGAGNDVVFTDPRDKIAGDCESVRR